MEDYIEIDLEDDNLKLYIDVTSEKSKTRGEMYDVGSDSEPKIVKTTREKFEKSLESVKYVGHMISEKLKDLKPQRTEVEFGIKLNADANVIISSLSTEVNFKVKLVWENAAE